MDDEAVAENIHALCSQRLCLIRGKKDKIFILKMLMNDSMHQNISEF